MRQFSISLMDVLVYSLEREFQNKGVVRVNAYEPLKTIVLKSKTRNIWNILNDGSFGISKASKGEDL